MHHCILFPLLIIALLSCNKGTEVNSTPTDSIPVIQAKTYLALGDSYTIGQSVAEADRFPNQVSAQLNINGVNLAVTNIIAATGWTTGNLESALNTRNPSPHDVVSLLIGVNDQYQTHDTSGYRARFTNLLERSIVLARGKKENVFVLSIPDYSVTPFARSYDTARIRYEIDLFNYINKQVTNLYSIQYVDITPSTREGRYDRSLIATDGLHPSGSEYKKWADKLYPLMKTALK